MKAEHPNKATWQAMTEAPKQSLAWEREDDTRKADRGVLETQQSSDRQDRAGSSRLSKC